jgi:hypothetical protein
MAFQGLRVSANALQFLDSPQVTDYPILKQVTHMSMRVKRSLSLRTSTGGSAGIAIDGRMWREQND